MEKGCFAVKCLSDCLMLHEVPGELMLKIRREILEVFRDSAIDCSLKIAASEACIRLVFT